MNESTPLKLAVIGAGPVGLALALHAAAALADAEITLFDARPADKDVAGDPRTLALSLGSVQLLERLGAWRADLAQPILEVHVSQAPPSTTALLGRWFGEPELRIKAIDEAVPTRRGCTRSREMTPRATCNIRAGDFMTRCSKVVLRSVARVESRTARTVADRGASSSRPSPTATC